MTQEKSPAHEDGTPPAQEKTPGGAGGVLQSWLAGLREVNQTHKTLMPELGGPALSPDDRRRLQGSGVRRYGYIDLVADVSQEFPQFWPEYVDAAEKGRLNELLRELEDLRNLQVFFETGARRTQDLLLIRGNAAYRLANLYYATVREAARRPVAFSEKVLAMLRPFWKRRRRPVLPPEQQFAETVVRAVEPDE